LVTGTAAMTPRRAEMAEKSYDLSLPQNTGQLADGGVGHARQTSVDAEPRRAGHLERRVDPLDLRADQLELIGRLDRWLGRELDICRVGRELAERRRAPGGFMPNEAAAREAGRGFDAPARGSGRDEPGAGRGARLLQERARAANGSRPSGPHRLVDIVVCEVAMRRSIFDLHLGEVTFELLGQDHRQ
jgi:hypothetical protein